MCNKDKYTAPPAGLAAARILQELQPLEDIADREKALLCNYIIALNKVTEDFSKETVIKLVEQAVDYRDMADDTRFTSVEIIEALLHANNIIHLDTVLNADDDTFVLMVAAACKEMRAFQGKECILCSEKTFQQLIDELEAKPVEPDEEGPIISKQAEFEYLLGYVMQSCFDDEICRDRLRMLWTAYCLHHNLVVGAAEFNLALLELWAKIEESGDGTSEWDGYDGFDTYMCKYLT